MKLHLSPDLDLPADAVTQKLAFLARSGAGKTYAAGKLVEELVAAKAQVVIVDPVGVWYGLRLAADGKAPGIPIYVFGGQHKDVPLEPTAGDLVAGLVAEKGISVVLDVSEMNGSEQRRFVADFATSLLQKKKQFRSPVMVVWEECQDFVPQNVRGDVARMVGAMERLIKQGRNFGVGTTLISQRPQAVNKDVLNQTEVLVVGQMTGPQERKTILGWVAENASQVADAVEKLPSLKRGEMFLWSPQWLRTFQKIHIGKKWTFDASSTPEFGKVHVARELAPVDLEAVRKGMAATIEKAKAEDPRELRKRIADLEREIVRMAREGKDVLAEIRTERVEVPVLNDRALELVAAAVGGIGDIFGKLEVLRGAVAVLQDSVATINKQHAVGLARVPGSAGVTRIPKTPASTSLGGRHAQAVTEERRRPASDSRTSGVGAQLPLGERRVLTAIAQHQGGVDREQLSVLTGYKRSSRDTYLQRLRERELISIRGDSILATSDGEAALGDDFEPLPTGALLRAHWLERLPEGERRILEVLLDAYPREIDRAHLDTVTGYKRSSRDTYLQRLGARKLVEPIGRGAVRANEELFS